MTDQQVTVAGYVIPCATGLEEGFHQEVGIVGNSKRKLLLKRVLWPPLKLWADLFVDGFIERNVEKLIRKYARNDSVFLENGCGDMSLMRFLPKGFYYNAMDLRLSEFHLRRVLAKGGNTNILLASATGIPSPSNVATLVVSTETFEHIPKIEQAIKEITV